MFANSIISNPIIPNAIIQGVTEFLPISSSLHLDVFNYFYKNSNYSLTTLHFGTLLSVLAYFYKDIFFMIKDFFCFKTQSYYFKKACLIIVATTPCMIVGFLLKNKPLINNYKILGIISIIFAVLLMVVDKKSQANNKTLSYKQAFFVGIMQCLAFIPGVSRLGITITAARLLKISRLDSVSFSIFLSIPTFFSAIMLSCVSGSINKEDFNFIQIFLTAIVGYFSIKLFLTYIKHFSLMPIMIYRILFGIFLLFI